MDRTLGYLREILSNYADEYSISKELFIKITKSNYHSEGAFVRSLSPEEAHFLNHILPDEIRYAKDAQDQKRAHELNEVFELLI